MSKVIADVIENTKDIFMSDSSLSSLLDFERVLDELDTYVFANWKNGELVEGPIYEKYFVTCTFMWPYKFMPDPRGGERLLEYGCEVRYKKEMLEYPVKVKTPDDFKPGTKVPRMAKSPIWLVEITMPKKLMQEITQGSLELESETVDAEDIDQSYEEGLDDKMYQTPADQGGAAPAPAAPGRRRWPGRSDRNSPCRWRTFPGTGSRGRARGSKAPRAGSAGNAP